MIMGIYSYYTVNSSEINRLLSFGGLYVLFGIIHYLNEMLSWYDFNEFSSKFYPHNSPQKSSLVFKIFKSLNHKTS